jgi:acetyltransferase
MSLKRLFEPRSVAVVGASRTPGKLGHDLFVNVKQGYKGKIYAVNPHGGKILNQSVYRSMSEIRKQIDLAIIIVPAAVVCDSVEEAARVGVRNFVIISAGFAEQGEAGKKLQHNLDEIKQRYHLHYLGPNCLGFINTKARLNASFARMNVQAGNVGLISQSGAMAVATLDLTSKYKLGISKMISIGNKGDLTEIESLQYLAEDRETKVIALYLEQVSRPAEFLQLAQRVVKQKPIIILKAGVTQSGQKAASSHTGSLAQSDDIISAAFHQVGIIRAHTIEELFSLTQAFSLMAKKADGTKTVVVSNAGGPAIITADALQTQKVELSKLSVQTKKALRQIVPAAASIANPIDLLGDADLQRFTSVLNCLLQAPEVDAVLLLVTPQTMTPVMPLARWLVKHAGKRSKKAVITCFLGHDSVRQAQEYLWDNELPSFDYPEQAVRYLAASFERLQTTGYQADISSFQTPIRYLDPFDSQNYLSRSGLHIIRGRLLHSKQQLATIRSYPIALKVVASGIVHKAASHGVAVDLYDRREAEQAWSRMMVAGQLKNKQKGWRGFLAQPMVRGGVEFFIGAKRDKEFGTVIIVGLGGSQLELIHDTAVRVGALTRQEAEYVLGSLRNQQLLTSAKRRILIQLLLKVQELMNADSTIQELDFNPILVTDTSYSILDVRIYVVQK